MVLTQEFTQQDRKGQNPFELWVVAPETFHEEVNDISDLVEEGTPPEDLGSLTKRICALYPDDRGLVDLVQSISMDPNLNERIKREFLVKIESGDYQRTLRDIKLASFLIYARANFHISEVLFPIITPLCLTLGPKIDNNFLSFLVTAYPGWGQFVFSPHTLTLRYSALAYNLALDASSHSLTRERAKQYLKTFAVASIRGIGCFSGLFLLDYKLGAFIMKKKAKDFVSNLYHHSIPNVVGAYGAMSMALGYPTETAPLSHAIEYYARKGIQQVKHISKFLSPLNHRVVYRNAQQDYMIKESVS
jgi:hypothetical protein